MMNFFMNLLFNIKFQFFNIINIKLVIFLGIYIDLYTTNSFKKKGKSNWFLPSNR